MYVYVEFKLPRKSFDSNELKNPFKVLQKEYPHVKNVANFEILLMRGTQDPNDRRGVGRLVLADGLGAGAIAKIKKKAADALYDFSLNELADVTEAKDLYNTLSGASATVSGDDIINRIPDNVTDV